MHASRNFFFLKHLCTCNTDNDFAASSNHACINSYNYFFSPPPQNQEWILLKHLVVRSEQKIHLANHREDSNLCGAFYKFILSNTQNGIQKNLCSMSIPHLKLCMFAQLLLQLKKKKLNTVNGHYRQLEVNKEEAFRNSIKIQYKSRVK